MPLYEDKHNAENKIIISEAAKNSVVCGTQPVLSAIVEKIVTLGKKANIALDGWYGVDFMAQKEALAKILTNKGINANFINSRTLFKPVSHLKEYKKPYITDDPGFGYVNSTGSIEDLMDSTALAELENSLKANKDQVIVVFGSGASVKQLAGLYDVVYYFDKTMQPLLWQMWGGELLPFGFDTPDKDYNWKEYYYCDFYLLFRHKKYMYTRMDYYVEAISFDDMMLIPRKAYDEIISAAVTYPIKQVQIFQPGPWGAYRYRDLWDIPGLECSAWNKMSGPELSVLIDFGGERSLNITLLSLMQYNEQVTGKYFAEKYPDLFPLDIWLDDGYFPEPQKAERTSMPIHNHPDTDYVKRHFNEPLGRYETYYIAEAYEGANTWMGFHDKADLEAFELKCRESNNLKPIENWKEYIANWRSNVGDLYLIPPGTTHGHGGNQMVLEMDTSPSIAGTEYSFFQYDFARNSWDDDKKTMTGKPLKMHLEHAFDNERYRRSSYVKDFLRSRPEIVTWNKEWWMDRYSTLPEMPFDVERLHFYEHAKHTTKNKHLQMLTLSVGKGVTIRSINDPSKKTKIERLQCAAIPACFGEYEIISDGGFCTCVIFYMKE